MQLKSTDKYPEFKALLDALIENNIDYESDMKSVMKNVIRREKGERFTLSEHLEGLVYALLSSQRRWEGIERNRAKINAIFHDFDLKYLKSVDLEQILEEIEEIKCGNRGIKKQILGLKKNIAVLESIDERYGSVDEFYDTKIVDELIGILSDNKSEYKITGMGPALAALYLKNMGISTEKPDVHTRRIIGMWGYSENSPKEATVEETHAVIHAIAEAYGITNAEADLIIWKGGESGVAY